MLEADIKPILGFYVNPVFTTKIQRLPYVGDWI